MGASKITFFPPIDIYFPPISQSTTIVMLGNEWGVNKIMGGKSDFY